MNILHGHGQICSWKAIAVDATRHGNPTFSYGLIHRLPIDLRRLRVWLTCQHPSFTGTHEQKDAAYEEKAGNEPPSLLWSTCTHWSHLPFTLVVWSTSVLLARLFRA